METITLELPDHWATALFYDDTSEPVDKEEGHFATYHDARQFGVLACNVSTYTFLVGSGNPKTSAMTTLAHTMK